MADESISEWRGKDQRHGKDGCPHVTKIVRKPKGVGMEIKNLADCDSGIMMVLEIVGPKTEMRKRQYAAAYGAGTSLLLRLSADWKGSGRLIVADSAFASVKSAVALRNLLGLYFHGLVKTAHSKFPKKYLNEVGIDRRGGHVICTAKEDGVDLRAITWNDGKKAKDGTIMRKNIVATCGTSLPGVAHKKRRWRVDEDGRSTYYFHSVPRPHITTTYFDNAQMIDVHNHKRQGRAGLALESRGTQQWTTRFHETIMGMVGVNSHLAYTRWCPGRSSVKASTYYRQVVDGLLNNTVGCSHDAPVLRPRPQEVASAAAPNIHYMKTLKQSAFFIGRAAAANAANKRAPQCVLKCRVCKKNASMFCLSCSGQTDRSRGIVALCGPKTGRDCFQVHQRQCFESVESDLDDV